MFEPKRMVRTGLVIWSEFFKYTYTEDVTCTPVAPVPRRQRQEKCWKFEASQGYRARPISKTRASNTI